MENNVVIKPLLKRFEVLYKNKGLRHIVLVGGRYSGKSWAVAEALMYYAITYKVRILCTRMVQSSISKSSRQIILDTIIRYGLLSDFDVTREMIVHKGTGAEFWFIGLHDSNSIRSLEGIDICWVEEAQAVSEDSGESLLPTIRKKNSIFFWSLNPIYETDWISKKFLGSNPPPDSRIINVNYCDMPSGVIDPAILKEIEHSKQDNFKKFQHIYMGGFADSTAGSFIPMSVLREAQARIPRVDTDAPTIIGIDIGGGGDPSAVCVRTGDSFKPMVTFDESDPQILGNKLAKVIKQEIRGSTICLDGGGIGWGMPAILTTLLGSDYPIVSVKFGSSPIDASKKALNRRSEMYMNLADALRSTLSIKDCPVELIQELAVIKAWETTSGLLQLDGKADIAKAIGRSTDYADAVALTYSINAIKRVMPVYRGATIRSSGSWMD